MAWNERLPNGTDAILAALPDSWKRIFKRRGQSGDGPEVDQRLIRPAWSGNDNPVELNAPQVTTGSLVSGRDPGEMIVSRGMPAGDYASGRPRSLQSNTPQPIVDTTYRPPQPDELPAQTTPIAPPSIQRNLPDTRSVNEPIAPPSIQANVPDTERTMPDIPSRNFSQFVLAPDQTKNPDYTPETIATRPKVVDELGYAENHTPMPRHGRIVEALKGAGLGFLRGVGTTGTLGGGLGGAATLGTMSAIDPKYAESAQNQMFTIPRLQQQEAIRVGRKEAALKQAGQAADINLKNSQTYRNLHPQVNKQHVTVSGRAMVFDPSTGIYSESNVRNAKQYKMGRDRLGPFFYTDDPNDKIVRPNGSELNQFVNVPGYGEMTPGQKYAADRQGFSEDVTADNENSQRTREQQIAQNQADYQTERDAWKEASDFVGKYNGSYKSLQKNISDAKALEGQIAANEREMSAIKAKGNPDDPNDSNITREMETRYRQLQGQEDKLLRQREDIEKENGRLVSETNAMGEEVPRHQKHISQLSSGYMQVGPEPSRPQVPPASPVRSRRMPAQGTQGSQFSGQRMSRANLPAVAKRWGVSPEQAESTFTQGGGVIY